MTEWTEVPRPVNEERLLAAVRDLVGTIYRDCHGAYGGDYDGHCEHEVRAVVEAITGIERYPLRTSTVGHPGSHESGEWLTVADFIARFPHYSVSVVPPHDEYSYGSWVLLAPHHVEPAR